MDQIEERYQIDKELGRGGIGVVYLGHDDLLDRPVAIKAMAREMKHRRRGGLSGSP